MTRRASLLLTAAAMVSALAALESVEQIFALEQLRDQVR